MRGYGDVGVNGINNPIEIYIACWNWGKYLGEEALSRRRGRLRLQLDSHRAQHACRRSPRPARIT